MSTSNVDFLGQLVKSTPPLGLAPDPVPLLLRPQVDALYIDLYVDQRARHSQDTDLTIIENAGIIGKLSGCRSLVATRDINMRMRAQALGVEAVKIVGYVIEPEG